MIGVILSVLAFAASAVSPLSGNPPSGIHPSFRAHTHQEQPSITTLHGLFTDNMVLQRDRPIKIWGTAAPGQKVTVILHDQSVLTGTNARGNWMVTLKPMPAGGPYTLNVRGDRLIQKQNVMLGEVWLCSGQSNMEFHLSDALNGQAEVDAANDPDLRLYHVFHRTVDEPLRDMNGTWSTCRPDTAKNFSAVAYFYGRTLRKALNVPVGLIEADWGGTPAESWTPRGALEAVPSLAPMVSTYFEGLKHLSVTISDYQRKLKAYNKVAVSEDPGNKGYANGWAEPEYNDSTWQDIDAPGNYKALLHLYENGGFWYRKNIEVPESAAGQPLTLQLGAVDDYDTTYFNGKEVGHIGQETPYWWAVPRVYKVPAELVKAGTNTIAVRVWNTSGSGGLMGSTYGSGESMRAIGAGGFSAPLDGKWRFAVETAVPEYKDKPPARPLAPGDPWVPSSLYNGMIAGLISFGIKGVIWYQGESNADRPYQYRTLFPTMIDAWRVALGEPTMPFYFVQLANYSTRSPNPVESDWALLREAQAMALRLPNTGMAVAIDIGSEETIHPTNKQEVARRLAVIALNRLYNLGGEYQGPTYSSMTVEGGSIRVKFTNTAGGLYSHGGPPVGFAIAGEDRKFVWAEGRIEGSNIILSAHAVPNPVAVRYAWDINPQASIYNGSGFPAVPFRTDDWPSPEDGPRN